MTPEEFLDFEDGHSYELIGGRPVERKVSINSSESGMEIGLEIRGFVRANGLGRVFNSELGIRIFPDPKDVRRADVSFIKAERAPKEESGYLEIAPDLVVEVNSPNDTTKEVREKVQSWLNAGVRAVWVAEPTSREVTVYRRGETPIVFTAESEITGGDALPGFVCRVERFFPA
jgi:Uma2 family endonuclease